MACVSSSRAKSLDSADGVRAALREMMLTTLAPGEAHWSDPFAAPASDGARPKIILFVGVNGVGKTTTIGKIAAQLHAQGKTVLLAAGDTFRAAAAEQLHIWGERSNSRVVRGNEGSDPASVIFNAVDAAKQADVDVVLADTAGGCTPKSSSWMKLKR